MSTGLDIEQQLREIQARQASEEGTPSTASIPFLSWNNYEHVSFLGKVTGTIVVLTMLLFMFSSVSKRLRVNLVNSRASVLSSLSPVLFNLLLSVWVVLIGLNGVFSLMKDVVHEPHLQGNTNHTMNVLHCDASNVQEWAVRPPALFLLAQYVTVIAVWMYFMWSGGNFQLGAALTLPAFFTSMYQSLVLEGTEPDRIAVWTTHFVFLISLFFTFSLGKPYIVSEWREAKRELMNHTNQALFKDRGEVRELRNRLGTMKTPSGSTVRKRK